MGGEGLWGGEGPWGGASLGSQFRGAALFCLPAPPSSSLPTDHECSAQDPRLVPITKGLLTPFSQPLD